MLIGALHWDPSAQKGNDDYNVYNTAFFLDTNTQEFKRYFKINLVPFSEALPFQGLFPMLSRVNLGQADFKRGKEETVFSIGSTLKPAPFICYEIIYPSYVRNRVRLGANILVNMTNDGWFGKSSGAYQHATMARMRCIENGISLARSANTGISMFVDQFGRILGKTQLYTRTELTGKISYTVIPTLYTRFGNWPVLLSLVICLSAGIMFLAGRKKKL
jgi:apolipoprotein N-acyltransferase